MENIVKRCNLIIGAGLYAAAFSVAALSLGSSRGTVLLGAPIDLFFEVQPDAGVSLADSCVSAQLVSGDVTIGSSRVHVQSLPEMPGRPSMVRVQAAAIVDEPVLTATLTVGCAGRMSRTYTFLTQVPEAAARGNTPLDVARLGMAQSAAVTPGTGAPPVVVRPTPERTRATAQPARLPVPAAGADEAQSARTQPAPAPRPPSAPAAASKPAAAVAKAAPALKHRADVQAQLPVRNAPPPTRPRLVMEPLDLSVEAPMPALHASPEMALLPVQTSPEVREQAAAAWKALSTDPKEVAAREGERVQALETQLKALQAKAAQERSAVADLRERLEAMEQDRFGSSWVYGLGLLLALALAALAWMWLRLKASQERVVRSWRDSVALAAAHDKALDEHYGEPSARDTWLDSEGSLPPTISQELPQRASPAVAPAVPVAVPAATLEPKAQAASDAQAMPEPVASLPAPVEASVQSIVNLEDLFDLLQQAEFFISVGEHDQAIEVLKKHIAERGEQSPFAYLELLRLYHQLGRADDYEQLRMQFLRHFNAQLPVYAQFHVQGRGLDHYVDALAEIEAQWTSSSVLALLEGYLFLRDGARPTHAAFDPAAYDDLLLLLAIAQTTPASGRGDPPPRKRTTPFGAPVVPVMPEVERVNDWGTAGSEQPPMISDRSIDSLIGDLALEPQAEALPVERPISEAMLDLDLSAPPPIMLDEVVEATLPKPQVANKAVGFGSINDKIEFSFELEPQNPKKD